MNSPLLTADSDDPAAIETLASAIREWEPRLDLIIPPTDAALFEPDGTLYAVVLSDELTVGYGYKRRSVGRGDLLIVPQSVALDAEPEIKAVGIRYEGAAPDHFRERFIQVWGFEHRPADVAPDHEGLVEIIPTAELSHRVPYAVWTGIGGAPYLGSTELGVVLLIGIDGAPEVVIESEGPYDLPWGRIVAVWPGLSYRLSGAGSVGCVSLATELVHESRRVDWQSRTQTAFSPEHKPRRQGYPP